MGDNQNIAGRLASKYVNIQALNQQIILHHHIHVVLLLLAIIIAIEITSS